MDLAPTEFIAQHWQQHENKYNWKASGGEE